MTEQRLTVDTITSDQLDALQDERDRLRAELDRKYRAHDSLDALQYALSGLTPEGREIDRAEKAERAANLLADSHRRAEQTEAELQRLRIESPWLRATAEDLATAQAAIARVRALRTDWLSTGAPPLGTSIARWWDKRLTELDAALDEPKEPTT